jgi:hypothetical protein
MLVAVVAWLTVVTLLMAGYTLVWLLCPHSRTWMEAPSARFLEQERRFPRVVHERPPQADGAILGPGPSQIPAQAPNQGAASPSADTYGSAGPVTEPAARA